MNKIMPLLAVLLTGVFSVQTFAGTVYWDIDGATPGGSGATTANGVWDLNTTANWSTSAAGDVATDTFFNAGGATPDVVFFAGTDVNYVNGTAISLDGAVTVNSITIEDSRLNTLSGVMGSSPTLTLGGGGITITNTGTASTSIIGGAAATTSSINLILAADQTWNIATGRTLETTHVLFSTNNTVKLSGSANLTINGDAAAGGSVILGDDAGLTDYTGNITIKGGSLSITSDGNMLTSKSSAGTGTITLGDTSGSRNATLMGGANSNKTYTNPIVVAGGSTGNTLTLTTVGLSNNPSFSGGITMNHDLSIAHAGSSGSLNITGTSGITTNGYTITTSTGVGNGSVNINTPISGSGGLIVNGKTTLLATNSSWTGPITVSAGITLNAASAATTSLKTLGSGSISLGNGSLLIFAANEGNGSDYQNGTVTVASGTASVSATGGSGRIRAVGSFDLGAGGTGAILAVDPVVNTLATSGVRMLGDSTINVSPTGAATGTFNVYGGVSNSGGSYSLTKTGTGSLTLGASTTSTANVTARTGVASTYGGDTNIEAGSIRVGMDNALPTGTTVKIASGAVLDLSVSSTSITGANFSQEIAGLSDLNGGGGTVTANSLTSNLAAQRVLTLSGNGNYTFSGRLVDKTANGNGVLGLSKTGSGTQTLSGASTYSGTTTVSGGILQAGVNNALGVQLTATGATTGVTASTTGTQDTTVSSGGTLDLNGKLFNSESITLNGTGAGSVGALVNNSGTTAVIGAGVNGLAISNVGSGYTSAPTINVTGGDGSGFSATAGLGISTISVTSGGTGYTATPTVTFSGGGGTGATGTVVRTGNVVTGITITNAGTGYTSMPTISFSTVAGASGAAASATAGVVDIINISNLGSGYNTTAPSLSFSDGGGSGAVATATYAANPVTLASDSSIGGTGDITINTAVAESGGARALTKVGAGTLTLSATNAYTGATSVQNGTLLVSSTGNINSTSGVSVTGGNFRYDGTTGLTRDVALNGGKFSYNSASNYGGTLTYTAGTIGGSNISNLDLTFGTGKIMSPGNSTGTMAAGATTWANGGTFLFEVNDATGTAGSTTAGWDLLNAASLNITAGVGAFTIEIASLDALQAAGLAQNFDGSSNYSWLFVDAGADITSFNVNQFVFTDSFSNPTTGTFSISQGDGLGGDLDKLYINYTGVIPEPSTYALLVGGLGLLAFLRRRKQS